MRVAKKLAWIVVGYGLAIGGGIAAVAINELLISDNIKQTSGGMVAFGDMIVFVLAAGFLSLIPTWLLLKLCVDKAPRTVLAVELAIAATGPVCWLTVSWLGGRPNVESWPQAISMMLGVLIAFGAIPRIVLGPVLVVIEGATCFMIRGRFARKLLGAAMLMDLIPMGLFALHMVMAAHRYGYGPS